MLSVSFHPAVIAYRLTANQEQSRFAPRPPRREARRRRDRNAAKVTRIATGEEEGDAPSPASAAATLGKLGGWPGREFFRLGGSEQLDILPAQLRVRVTRRPRYACRTCEGAVFTEAPVAHVLVSKFGDSS